MPNYRLSKIYKIVCTQTDDIYVGSTTVRLSRRIAQHRSSYKSHLAGKSSYCSSFDIVKHGCSKIVLLEKLPTCVDREELLMHERRHYDVLKEHCVNRNRPHVTDEEKLAHNRQYYNNNHDKQIIYKRQYYENNKEKIASSSKRYYSNNRVQRVANQKTYNATHKAQISAYNKMRYQGKKAAALAVQRAKIAEAQVEIDRLLEDVPAVINFEYDSDDSCASVTSTHSEPIKK